MKKKTVSIMVAATMALSLFAGCGSSKDTATEDTSKTESTETTDESSENASAETTDESSRTTFTVGFDAEYARLFLSGVHFSDDSSFMPFCTYLFGIRY